MVKLRMTTDPNNQYRTLVWMLPQDVIDNTIKAFNLTPTGYASGEPTGRYFAPANGPDCLEIAATSNTNWNAGYGDCGTGSLLVTGPKNIRWDMNFVKQIPIAGKLRAEFQLQVFNVFNRVNFSPVNLPTSTANAARGSTTTRSPARSTRAAPARWRSGSPGKSHAGPPNFARGAGGSLSRSIPQLPTPNSSTPNSQLPTPNSQLPNECGRPFYRWARPNDRKANVHCRLGVGS